MRKRYITASYYCCVYVLAGVVFRPLFKYTQQWRSVDFINDVQLYITCMIVFLMNHDVAYWYGVDNETQWRVNAMVHDLTLVSSLPW